MFQLLHLVKVSVSVNAWLGIVETYLEEVRDFLIVPWLVAMIKTELIGIEYVGGMGGAGV